MMEHTPKPTIAQLEMVAFELGFPSRLCSKVETLNKQLADKGRPPVVRELYAKMRRSIWQEVLLADYARKQPPN